MGVVGGGEGASIGGGNAQGWEVVVGGTDAGGLGTFGLTEVPRREIKKKFRVGGRGWVRSRRSPALAGAGKVKTERSNATTRIERPNAGNSVDAIKISFSF